MIIEGENLAKRQWNTGTQYNINIDLQTLNIFCRYILQDSRILRMEHLVNMRKLFKLVDRSTYENDPDKLKGLILF